MNITQTEIKNRFPLPIRVEKIDGSWKTIAPFCYVMHSGGVVWINSGFKTDFASTPRIIWSLYPPTSDKYIRQALTHDGLYASELKKRNECDWIFLESMQDGDVNWFDRNVFYSAVRTAGWSVWKEHTAKSITEALSYVEIISLPVLCERINPGLLAGEVV